MYVQVMKVVPPLTFFVLYFAAFLAFFILFSERPAEIGGSESGEAVSNAQC